MTKQTKLAGNFAFPNTSVSVYRMGYGAMQLAGPGVWGPPRNVDAAVAVLREATAAGVNHIDTSDFYGPHVTNQIIKQALYPYPNDLVIVSKVGYRRGTDKSWLHAVSPQELIDAVHDNLRNLGLSALDLVNLRVGGVAGPTEGSIEEPMTVLAELKRKGLIRHLGVSNVTSEQLDEARRITDIACVQNFYNIANRNDDAFIDRLATEGIPYVPFFPLGGFTPLQSSVLDRVPGRRREQFPSGTFRALRRFAFSRLVARSKYSPRLSDVDRKLLLPRLDPWRVVLLSDLHALVTKQH